jgi:hypothetical protein
VFPYVSVSNFEPSQSIFHFAPSSATHISPRFFPGIAGKEDG